MSTGWFGLSINALGPSRNTTTYGVVAAKKGSTASYVPFILRGSIPSNGVYVLLNILKLSLPKLLPHLPVTDVKSTFEAESGTVSFEVLAGTEPVYVSPDFLLDLTLPIELTSRIRVVSTDALIWLAERNLAVQLCVAWRGIGLCSDDERIKNVNTEARTLRLKGWKAHYPYSKLAVEIATAFGATIIERLDDYLYHNASIEIDECLKYVVVGQIPRFLHSEVVDDDVLERLSRLELGYPIDIFETSLGFRYGAASSQDRDVILKILRGKDAVPSQRYPVLKIGWKEEEATIEGRVFFVPASSPVTEWAEALRVSTGVVSRVCFVV